MRVRFSFIICVIIVTVASPSLIKATTIRVDATQPQAPIARELWGQNTMWFWFNEYFEPGGATAYQALKSDLRLMGVPALRAFLGETFQWEKAIGPSANRPPQILGNSYHQPALFGVDEFLQLCEYVGAEPQFILPFYRLDQAKRSQAENIYTELDDVGADNIAATNTQFDDLQHLVLPDINDAVQLTFSVPGFGYYRLHLRNRAGSTASSANFWDQNAYLYQLDGKPITFTGDGGTLSALDSGSIVWGTARSNPQWLAPGTHKLSVAAAAAGLRVDFLEVLGLNHDVTVKRSAALVAYCNGHPGDTRPIGVDQAGTDWKTVGYWAALRGQSDYGNHPAPYGVKCWEVGNEPWGDSPYIAETNADTYCDAWSDYQNAVGRICPELRVSLAGFEPENFRGDEQWDAVLMRRLGATAGYLHFHPYFPYDNTHTDPQKLYFTGVTAAAGIQTELNLYRQWLNRYMANQTGRFRISASEWAAAFGWGSSSEQSAPRNTAVRWTGAIAIADQLGTFSKNADLLASTHYWMLMPGDFCVFEFVSQPHGRYGHFRHGLFEVFHHYNHFFGGHALPVAVEQSPTYSFPGFNKHWGSPLAASNYPYLTAYAGQDDGACYLVVINKDPLASHTAAIQWDGLPPAIHRVSTRTIHAEGSLPNYTAINTAAHQAIVTDLGAVVPFTPSMDYVFPASSITGFIVEKAPPANSRRRMEAEDFVCFYGSMPEGRGWCVNGALDSGRHVLLPDPGIEAILPFSITTRGYYTLRMRMQSGTAQSPTQNWDQDSYRVCTDGAEFAMEGLPSSLSEADAAVGAVWGTMQKEHVFLEPGRHYLKIGTRMRQGRIDWIEAQQERFTIIEAEDSAVTEGDTTDSFLIRDGDLDSGRHVRLAPGNGVRIPFQVPVAGDYRLHLRLKAQIGPDVWDPGREYTCSLDQQPCPLALDPETLSRAEPDGLSRWATGSSPQVRLTAGQHFLTVSKNGTAEGWLDYLALELDASQMTAPTNRVNGWALYM